MSQRPYIVRQRRPGELTREVVHRATGRYLGRVGQHDDCGFWSTWGPAPYDDCAVGEMEPTMHQAIDNLLDPQQFQPLVSARKCPTCRNIVSMQPRDCEECETDEQALARSRRDDPEWWVQHDWLLTQENPKVELTPELREQLEAYAYGRTIVVVGSTSHAQALATLLEVELLDDADAHGHPLLNDSFGDVLAIGVHLQDIEGLLRDGCVPQTSWLLITAAHRLPPKRRYDTVARARLGSVFGDGTPIWFAAWDARGLGFQPYYLVRWTQTFTNPEVPPSPRQMWLQRVQDRHGQPAYRHAENPNCHVGASLDDELLQVRLVADPEALPTHLGGAWTSWFEDQKAGDHHTCGFIAPNGAFFACKWHQHLGYLRRVFLCDEIDLVGKRHREGSGKGWVVINCHVDGKDPFWLSCGNTFPRRSGCTEPQYRTLKALGLIERFHEPTPLSRLPEDFSLESPLAERVIALVEQQLGFGREMFFPGGEA